MICDFVCSINFECVAVDKTDMDGYFILIRINGVIDYNALNAKIGLI